MKKGSHSTNQRSGQLDHLGKWGAHISITATFPNPGHWVVHDD